MRRCADHQFLTYVSDDERFYSYPIHADDIPEMPEAKQIESELSAINMSAIQRLDNETLSKMTKNEMQNLNNASLAKNFEEFWINSIGETLYTKFVDQYSRKCGRLTTIRLLMISLGRLKVTVKQGARAAWDTAISAYPIAFNGYDDYFKIATEETSVHLSTRINDYDIPNKTVVINGEKKTYDIIINTISPDHLFEQCHGELAYIGRDLHTIVLPVEFALPEDVYFIYFAGSENFTESLNIKNSLCTKLQQR